MLEIFLKTMPFFALVLCGYIAARTRFFPADAAKIITKFVFYFALSAMLFRLSATLPLEKLWQPEFLIAYAVASSILYALVMGVAAARKLNWSEAGFEAHTAVIGNVGFLGLPMFVSMFGPSAAAPIMMGLIVDLVLFGSIIVIIVEAGKGDGRGFAAIRTAIVGLLKNPMIMAVVAGLVWSVAKVPMVGPLDEFTQILGAAATPGALFAIGCSLASQSADQKIGIAVWLTVIKLVAHPVIVAIFVLGVFDVDPFVAAIAICSAAMPTAGNVFILAQHYGIGEHRVSATILLSTAISVLTVTLVIGLVGLSPG